MLVHEALFSDFLIGSEAFIEEVGPSFLGSLVSSYDLVDNLLSLRLIKFNSFWHGGGPHLNNCVSCLRRANI